MTNHKATDVGIDSVALYFLPVTFRVPLKFGRETMTSVTCARTCVTVRDSHGRRAQGWGETPLSVQWAWPSALPYDPRHRSIQKFCTALAQAWAEFGEFGHPIELGHDFQRDILPTLCAGHTDGSPAEPLPQLAALICLSAFDIALHDAFGNLHQCDIYSTYNDQFMSRKLSDFISPAEKQHPLFQEMSFDDFLVAPPATRLAAWHLVGGLDPLEDADLDGSEPEDGFPVLLRHWIKTDGLSCLKIKLRGNDAVWDYGRLVQVGRISIEENVRHLSADFNCTVTEPAYVNEILDRLHKAHPVIYDRLLYVEQPFPYDLEAHPIDVSSVSARKPLFLDESAHDWRFVRLGRKLGWSGVALKTCKTQTGALLSLCWAKAHGMPLMVQDLTNPMLAQIPHVRLAAHAGTIMGVETNGMQFYPEASAAEALVHPGIYQRRNGELNLESIQGPGFGYRINEMERKLPEPVAVFSSR